MPTELLAVTEVAQEFLSRSGYPFARLEKADFDEAAKQWILTFDVSISGTKLKRVRVDATGKVVAFE